MGSHLYPRKWALRIHGHERSDLLALDLIRHYEQFQSQNGGGDGAQGFARLFLAPGMNHCNGGPGLCDFDDLAAMQDWV